MREDSLTLDSLGLDTLAIPLTAGADSPAVAVLPSYAAPDVPLGALPLRADSLREAHPGLDGTPLPYRLQADTGLSVLLLLCFLASAYALAHGKKYLMQQVRAFFYVRLRSNLFDGTTADDFRYSLVLFVQTLVLMGACSFGFFASQQPDLSASRAFPLLSVHVCTCLVYYLLKWLLYAFVGWIFLDKERLRAGQESYFVLLCCQGFAFFALLLSLVYFGLSPKVFLVFGLIIVIIAKILVFCKWVRLFLGNLYGLFGLILYFCALELLPGVVLFKALGEINQLFLLKL